MTDFDRGNPVDDLKPEPMALTGDKLASATFTGSKAIPGTLELTAAMASRVTQSTQEAEDFTRIWTAIYESVMEKTRDHAKAVETADQSWEAFRATLEEEKTGV